MNLTITTSGTASKETAECQIGHLPDLDHDKGPGGNISLADFIARVHQNDLRAGRSRRSRRTSDILK